MMLILWRIVFGAALVVVLSRMFQDSGGAAVDPTSGGYMALALILGLANAVVWAPWIGEKLTAPLDTLYVRGAGEPPANRLLAHARNAEQRGRRRLALVLAFIEAVRHPNLLPGFAIGLRNAKPGSRLERLFAWEVYRFTSIDQCLAAWRALRRHGIEPPPHPDERVQRALLAELQRELLAAPRPRPAETAAPTETAEPAGTAAEAETPRRLRLATRPAPGQSGEAAEGTPADPLAAEPPEPRKAGWLFRGLHWGTLAVGWAAAVGAAFVIYQHRAAATPAIDAWRALFPPPGIQQQVRGEITGVGRRVLDETAFQMELPDRRRVSVRLTGIQAPSLLAARNPRERAVALEARKRLGSLVLSNQVQVQVTYVERPGALLGLVEAQGTNVNLAFVRDGLARVRSDQLRGLPFKVRYALLRADRLAAAAREALAAGRATNPPPASTTVRTNRQAEPADGR
ncbi:MAG: hypothetical protein D6766_05935 [Verrucomicrobia bacterium]|nr:MAG: hypothetical protein D6766_05935 [Verrucomicrobiota bacterium]